MFFKECNIEEDTDTTLVNGANAVDTNQRTRKSITSLDAEHINEILGTFYDDENVHFMTNEHSMNEPSTKNN